ncbi:MAG: DUF2652 domain-containing protein [Chloroflexota bacterium]
MTETGYMILADITGYTQYLNHSELDHAQEIITSLINRIITHLHVPIHLSRVEGDMVFAYTLDGEFIQGQALLEALEHIYYEFSHELENSDRNTTCGCKACANMESLDLKIVVHHGEFGLQQLGTQTELIGNDVNAAHRLLKNHVIEKTGIEAYLYISDSAAKKMLLGGCLDTLTPHTESYDNIGEIAGFVYDLKPLWNRERERRRVMVNPEEADSVIEFSLPIPPAIAWTYVNEPEYRAVYRHSDNNSVSGSQNGRVDIGTTYHCAHGDNVTLETILDWKPFEYVTYESGGKILGAAFTNQITIYFKKTTEGSEITISSKTISGEDKYSKIIMPLLGSIFNPFIKKSIMKWHPDINNMINADKETGKLKMLEIAAQADA